MISEPQVLIDLVEIPPGSFWMGESHDDKFATDTERPRHHVEFRHAFALGRTPVTVEEYRRFSPHHAPGEVPHWPVVNVTWFEADEYCLWLSEQSGRSYRLPFEAEWEYACRGGSEYCFVRGNTLDLTEANFLYSEQGEKIGVGRRTAVGSYPSNPYALADMHGNVCELMADVWHFDYRGAPSNGGPWLTEGSLGQRVIRGGAWDYLPRLLRSAWRGPIAAPDRRDNVGFRVATTLSTT